MVQSATALLACGRTDTALRALVYLACTQHPDGGFAQNFWIDGTPYWSGIQLDEVAFPIILAWRLWKLDGLGNFDVFPFVERAAALPRPLRPRHPAGALGGERRLLALHPRRRHLRARLRRRHRPRPQRRRALGSFLETTPTGSKPTSTSGPPPTDGVLHPERQAPLHAHPPARRRRALPQRPDPAPASIHIANRGPGEKSDFEAREVIDGGFLELVRYGIRRADDPLIVDSLKVVDAVPQDRHALRPLLAPLQPRRLRPAQRWRPLLTAGARAAPGRCSPASAPTTSSPPATTSSPSSPPSSSFSSVGGMLPEQVWDYADLPSEGMYFGRSAGSAQPLVWAHAEYIKLLRSVADGKIFDTHLRRRGALRRRHREHAPSPAASRSSRSARPARRDRPPASRCASWTHSASASSTPPTTGRPARNVESNAVGYPGSFADIPTRRRSDRATILSLPSHWPARPTGRTTGSGITQTSRSPRAPWRQPLGGKPAPRPLPAARSVPSTKRIGLVHCAERPVIREHSGLPDGSRTHRADQISKTGTE